MTKEELEKEAREYLAEHSKYSEVFGEFFVAVDTLTAMLDFAEPREKRIAELKKACDETQELLDKQIEATYKLDKENAELKRDYDQRGNIITSLENQLRMYIHSDKTDQLTKAVKHLKDLVYVVELGKNELATARILAEAKEFLKEE